MLDVTQLAKPCSYTVQCSEYLLGILFLEIPYARTSNLRSVAPSKSSVILTLVIISFLYFNFQVHPRDRVPSKCQSWFIPNWAGKYSYSSTPFAFRLWNETRLSENLDISPKLVYQAMMQSDGRKASTAMLFADKGIEFERVWSSSWRSKIGNN